jgi:hypothetical protein
MIQLVNDHLKTWFSEPESLGGDIIRAAGANHRSIIGVGGRGVLCPFGKDA